MKAIIGRGKLPKNYERAIMDSLKETQSEVAKRLVLCSVLVLSDGFGFDNAALNKFKRMLEEVVHGYADEVYKCRTNVGNIEDMRTALEVEIDNRGIVLEAFKET